MAWDQDFERFLDHEGYAHFCPKISQIWEKPGQWSPQFVYSILFDMDHKCLGYEQNCYMNIHVRAYADNYIAFSQ